MAVAQRINGALRRVPTWLLYVAGALLPAWYFYLGVAGRLGVDPIKGLEHQLGEIALYGLVATLAVTPLRRLTGVNLVRYRRAMGLVTFFWVVCHLLTWLILDVGIPSQIWADILKRPYITIGMGAFVLMIPLSVTSNNMSIRRMGPVAWRRLHKLTYAAAVLGAVHYVMLVKGWQPEPLIWLAVILGFLALRLPWPKRLAAA